MKKFFLIAAAIVAFGSFNASAQGKMGVSVGAEVGLPVGDWSTSNSVGFGGTAVLHYQLIENTLDYTGSVGFLSFSGKSQSVTVPFFGTATERAGALSVVPIRVGANWFPIEDLGLYLGADLGVNFFNISPATFL